MKRTGVYGMMAEFDSDHTLLDGGQPYPRGGLSRRSTPIARFPSKDWPKRSDSITTKFPWWC